jgi:hypothetical protein
VRLIDFEALIQDGSIERALRSIPRSSDLALPAVYRGWMMTPDQYLAFSEGYLSGGSISSTNLKSTNTATIFPSGYPTSKRLRRNRSFYQ